MDKKMQCPHCGNYVEGKKIKSYSNKVARQGAKTLVHGATSMGGAGIGATVGTAILPGIGTVLGAAAGFIGSAMFNQKVNEGIDKAGDFIEEEFADIEYEYTCPKCGKRWTSIKKVDYSSSISKSIQNNSSSSKKNDSSAKMNEIQFLVINIASRLFNTSLNLDNSFCLLDQQYKQIIVEQIKKELDVSITTEMIDQFNTYHDLADYVEKNVSTLTNAKILVLKIAKGVLGPAERTIDSSFAQLGQKNKERIRKAVEERCNITISDYEIRSFNTYRDIATVIEAKGWRPKVKPIINNNPNNNQTITKQGNYITSEKSDNLKDQEYLDALKDFLQDGDISDRERRMLDRIRQALGISEQCAAELEASLKKPQLTEDEQEYLDMYREYTEEGSITEKIRNRLDRFASALGISPEREKN